MTAVPPVSVGDVAEVGLAALTEAGRLDGAHVEDALEAVDDERREGLALDVLGEMMRSGRRSADAAARARG